MRVDLAELRWSVPAQLGASLLFHPSASRDDIAAQAEPPQSQAVRGCLWAGAQPCPGHPTLHGACRKPGPSQLGCVPRRGAFPRDGQFSSPCFLRQPQRRRGLQNTRLISRGDQVVCCNHCSEISLSYKIQTLFGKRAVKTFFTAEGADDNGRSVTTTEVGPGCAA